MEEKFLKRYYLIFFSTILGALTTNSLIPLFEELRINFGLNSIALVAFALSFYIFPFAIFQIFAGTFSDIVDKKKVVVFGFIIFIVGLYLSLIAVYIQIFYLFLIAFLIQGIGFSFINPTILAILNTISPERKKGLLMGFYNSTGGIGVSVGAFLSGFLVNNFAKEWKLLFLINPIIAILALIFFIIALRNCTTLVCRTYESEEKTYSEKKGVQSIILATIRQLKEEVNITIVLFGFIGFSCFFTVITLTNTLNEQIRSSISEKEVIFYVSLILIINGIISITLSPITGLMLKKINPFIMLIIGFSIMLVMILMPFGSSIIDFMVISFLTYIGSAFIWPALFKVSMDLDPDKSGTNSAIINSLRFLGYALVGPFYLIFGIPVIYYWVLGFNISAIIIILIIRKINK